MLFGISFSWTKPAWDSFLRKMKPEACEDAVLATNSIHSAAPKDESVTHLFLMIEDMQKILDPACY